MTTTAVGPSTTDTHTASDGERRDALAERLFGAVVGGIELLTVDLGRRLGLYAAVRQHGPVTAGELAASSGIVERYAREWLEQQAAAGILDVAADSGDAESRRFTLPAPHASVLLDEDDPACMMGAAPALSGLAMAVPAVMAAYRTGGGVPYAAYGAEIRHGLAGLNRPMFAADLPGWLATMPDVVERLRAGGRILDAGCGVGWSTIALARAFPEVRAHGIDLDEASVAEARANAASAGLAGRVTFEAGDVADLDGAADPARYDLACVFEALHDMGEPIAALNRLRTVLAPGGAVLVADERVADAFTAPADEVERFQYGWSVLHCLPATMAESTAVASGTILRTSTVRAWAAQSGFAGVDVLPVDNPFWRFYRLDPPSARSAVERP